LQYRDNKIYEKYDIVIMEYLDNKIYSKRLLTFNFALLLWRYPNNSDPAIFINHKLAIK